jgi:hypothetical protein
VHAWGGRRYWLSDVCRSRKLREANQVASICRLRVWSRDLEQNPGLSFEEELISGFWKFKIAVGASFRHLGGTLNAFKLNE